VLLVEQSRDAESRGFTVEARNLATAARRANPGFVPAVLRFARFAAANGDTRAARRSLERAWAAGPHPELATAALDLVTDEGEAGALARVRAAERLAKARPEDALSHVTVAEAALDAQLWGEARSRLALALAGAEAAGEAPSARVCRLMARLEEEDRRDHATAHTWLARLGDAPPEARWLCRDCGAGFAAWSALCPDCRAFASLEWKVPEGVTLLTGTTAVLAPGTKPKGAPIPAEAGESED
jgi:HemY protein